MLLRDSADQRPALRRPFLICGSREYVYRHLANDLGVAVEDVQLIAAESRQRLEAANELLAQFAVDLRNRPK